MEFEASAAIQKTVRALWDVGAIGRLTDAQLLERFLAGHNELSEAAFAVLVERHGPALRRLCLDLLGDPHEAQDTAQAAFLVLARKARSILKPGSLGPWLHGVAVRLARRARAEAARRREVEKRKAEIMASRFHARQATEPELHLELHEEIERLPEKYRSPIVLCYLQSHTQEQASQQLGWPLGTVQTRLHRGRERLRSRLARRGIGLSSLAATVLTLADETASAVSVPVPLALPPGWVQVTASAAVRFAARNTPAELVTPWVVRLAQGVLTMMLRDTLRAVALWVLAVGLAGAGLSLGVHALASGREPPGIAGTVDDREVPPTLAQAEPMPVMPPAPKRPAGIAATVDDREVPPTLAQAEPVRAMLPAPKRPDVEQAIKAGVRYLNDRQRPDGSWPDADSEAHTGTTSLVALALLAADEPADAPTVTRAVEYLRGFMPDQLRSVYAVSLQTMVFAAVAAEPDRPRIARNARWLEDAQIKPGDRVNWPGSWTYSAHKSRNGDNSNTQHAILGLNAASAVGVPVKPQTWALAHRYWEQHQRNDGGWGYTPDQAMPASASMTCAGISSLVITGLKQPQGQERRVDDQVQDCGNGVTDARLQRGIDWMANHFQVGENFAIGQQWRYYYLGGLERAGRLTGQRFFGEHEWYLEGAEKLLQQQDRLQGSWQGAGPVEGQEPVGLVATSFALMFLGQGRSPVLIQKARHAPGNDWKNDPDDVRNLVESVAQDWKQRLKWQVVDLDAATVDDLLQAPILFLNGHQAPELNTRGKKNLHDYVEQGGFVFAEACCGKDEFDQGFRRLLEEVFPAPMSRLHILAEEHPVWQAKHRLIPNRHPLWGLELGGRTVLIYSPRDLSCQWNLRDRYPARLESILAIRVGQNVIAHACGKKAVP